MQLARGGKKPIFQGGVKNFGRIFSMGREISAIGFANGTTLGNLADSAPCGCRHGDAWWALFSGRLAIGADDGGNQG